MVELEFARGNEIRRFPPGQGKSGGGHRVQPQGADGVSDGLHLHLRGLQVGQVHGGCLEAHPPGLVQIHGQKVGHVLQGQDVALPVPHQQVPDLLPVQTQAQNGAQKVPVAQSTARPGAADGLDGAVALQPHVLLLPVGEECAHRPLRPRKAAVEQVPGMAAGIEQVFHTHPLLWG